MNRSRPPVSPLLPVLSLLVPLAFGLLGLALGKEAGWDLQNYHWYNPYAWLHDRLHFDLAAGHHATYYNPLIDLPLYIMGSRLPASLVGFLLAALHGLNFVLLLWLAWRLLRIESPAARAGWAAAIALAGMLGGGALTELGGTSGDNLVSLPIFASLLLLAVKSAQLFRPERPRGLLWLPAAGVLLGAAMGLKLTAAIYLAGFVGAVLFLPLPWRRRLWLAALYGLGAALGFLLCAGGWMYTLWQTTGNPLFPYFNELFHSPLIKPESYRDLNFIPNDPWVRLLFPFHFSFDPYKVAEFPFRDLRILAAFILIPPALLLGTARRLAADYPPLVAPLPGRLLLAGAAITYGAWLTLFCIYRYLIPLEMLTPLLMAAAIGLLPLSRRAQLVLLGTVLLATQLAAKGWIDRQPWGERFVEVQAPPLAEPANTMILTAGFAPVSYVIPAFPPEVPFLRIHGWLVGAEEQGTGLSDRLHRRVAEHKGAFYAIFPEWDQPTMSWALERYGLRLGGDCREVTSNIAAPLRLCAAYRAAGEAP